MAQGMKHIAQDFKTQFQRDQEVMEAIKDDQESNIQKVDHER